MLNLTKDAVNWINGELLGDGTVEMSGPRKARFRYSSKHEEYINYVRDTLKSFGIMQVGRVNKYVRGQHCFYCYCSHAYKELLPCRKAWYPDGKKIVPRCIVLSSITCRQWYIGDGCLVLRHHRNPYIELYTCAFPISDVEWLIKQLSEIGILATRKASRNIILIASVSVSDFLNYITGSPVECYRYKWNVKSIPSSSGGQIYF